MDRTPPETVSIEEVLARRLRQLRAERDLTQERLAEVIASYGRWKPGKVGIARIELNDRKVKVEELLDIAAALEVGVVDLLRPYPGQVVEVGPYRLSRIAEQVAGEVAWSDWRNFRPNDPFDRREDDRRLVDEAPRVFSFRQTEGGYGYLWHLLADVRVEVLGLELSRRLGDETSWYDAERAAALAYETREAVTAAKKKLDAIADEVDAWARTIEDRKEDR